MIVLLCIITDQYFGFRVYGVIWSCCVFQDYLICCFIIKPLKTADWYLQELASQNGEVSMKTDDFKKVLTLSVT